VQRPVRGPAGARAELVEHRVAGEVQLVPAAVAEGGGLEPGERPTSLKVLAQGVEVGLRDVRLADELLDLLGEQDAVGLGLVEEAGDRVGGHRHGLEVGSGGMREL
jgi:hypothetical protein